MGFSFCADPQDPTWPRVERSASGREAACRNSLVLSAYRDAARHLRVVKVWKYLVGRFFAGIAE